MTCWVHIETDERPLHGAESYLGDVTIRLGHLRRIHPQ